VSLQPGSTLGPYEIVSLLGAGGMGEVYRCVDPRLARDVAVKVIRRALVHDTTALDRLLREASLASALNHPNIVTIYETGSVGTDRYIAMELVEGTTLREACAAGLPAPRALGLIRQVAEALAVAHAAQIVHRDIKPENVMVRPDGYVKLLDFGLARLQPDALAAGQTTGATEAGMILGTIGYMAPEQARGDATGAEADIFALGVMLYELLTGRHPFTAASPLGTLHALMWETPEPPSHVTSEIPRAIDQLILEMLQKDARLRPGATEVMYRLALVHDSALTAALAEAAPRRPSPLRHIVGRDADLDVLVREFARVANGRASLVLVSGEAGMGKTTLVDAFLRQLADQDEPVRVGRGRCSERLAGSEAYLPVLEVLDSLQRSERHGNVTRLVRTVAPSWYAQIAPPSGNDSSAARLAAETVGGSQERLKREIAALLEELGRLQPLVLYLDDVHWADPSSVDLIAYLARRLEHARVMAIFTARPSVLAQARHPFLALKHELQAHGLIREIALALLTETDVDRYLALQYPEHAFPPGLAALIHRRTDGQPLFVADLVRELRRRDVLRQQDGRWVLEGDLSSVAELIPESVRSLLQAKLAALEDEDRRLLGAAAVQGTDFDSAVLARALQIDDEVVESRLDRLEREHALVRFAGEAECPDRSLTLRYQFAHDVYYRAFLDSLRATRRVSLSRAVADALIARCGDAAGEGVADIALLLEAARDNLRAAEYWNRAAQAAARLYAHDETARMASRGLGLLEGLPASAERAAAELSLQMTYGLAMKTSRGYAVPEVGRAYARARELAREVPDPARVVPVLIGLSAHHVVSGEIRTSYEVSQEMLALFQKLGDPNLEMLAEWATGAALFHLGDIRGAHAHLERSLELYDPAFHGARVWQTGIEPGIFARCELARTRLLLGAPDQGLACVESAVAAARALDHPQPLAFSLLFRILLLVALRRPHDVLTTHAELEAICQKHGIAQELHWAIALRGRALVEIGDTAAGVRLIEEGLAAHTLSNSALLRPYYLQLYAGALLRAGRLADARAALERAGQSAAETGQTAYESERHRLLGTILGLERASSSEAEREHRTSLEIAQAQGARWLALRSARALASHLACCERTGEARAVLEPVLADIAEGHDAQDFLYADALLRTLRTG
jgi:predicted ATPase